MNAFDVRAWVVWLMVGGLLAIWISNPLYLLLLLVISRLVSYACRQPAADAWRIPFWRVSVVILFFSTIFNMLTAHVGQTVIYTLPATWPLIGGQLTLEAAAYGFISGLRLVTMLSFYLAFNAIVPVSQLSSITPRALHELGLVMLIAITYLPETARQFQRIRDAQAIRGHKIGGVRTWRPVLIPLLIAGLERALNLAETMVARGYGSTSYISIPLRSRLMLVAGLLLILSGALWLMWFGSGGWWLMVVGIGGIAWAYIELSRMSIRTQYRPRRWTAGDSILVVSSLVALLPILSIAGINRATLSFAPYPSFTFPPFDLWVGIALLGLAAPAVMVSAIPATLEAIE